MKGRVVGPFFWAVNLSAMVRFIDTRPAYGLPPINTRFFGIAIGPFGIGVIRQCKEKS